MAVFECVTELACAAERAWDFLARPANALLVTPPDFHAKLLEGPEVLSLGSRITVQIRRYGIRHAMTSEVTAFEPARLLRDEQAEGGGPFRRWSHAHALEPAGSGCVMTDRVEFEPPGGLMGLMVTEAKLLRELNAVFAYRSARFRELLGGAAP